MSNEDPTTYSSRTGQDFRCQLVVSRAYKEDEEELLDGERREGGVIDILGNWNGKTFASGGNEAADE